MKILALDQALGTTGYAFFENEKLINYGSFTIKKTLPIEVRLHDIQKNILKIISEQLNDNLPDVIVFEGIQNQQNNETYKKLAYCQAAIMLLCYELEIKFTILSPSEWRKLNGGGYGKVRAEQKEKAIQRIKEWYDVLVDSDIADAINIGKAYNVYINQNKSAF